MPLSMCVKAFLEFIWGMHTYLTAPSHEWEVLNWVKMVKKLKTMKQKTESNLNIRFIPLIFLIISAKLSVASCFCPPHPMILLLPFLPHYGGLYLQTIKSKSKSLLPYPTSCYVICYNSKIVTNTESQWLPSEFGKNNSNVLVVNCLRVFSKSAEKTFSRCTRKSLCQPDPRWLFQKLFQWGKCFQ